MVSSRALPIAEWADSPIAEWADADIDYPLLWPPADELAVRAAWAVGSAHVALVEDERIMRTYLAADGTDAVALMSDLVAGGVAADPDALIATARAASGWGALGDTLYDVIAGCVDPGNEDVIGVWLSRVRHEHPLIRLAAAWTAPYLPVDQVRAEVENLASRETDQDIRDAAQSSLAALERLG